MQRKDGPGNVVAVANLAEYFRDALQGALAHQHLAVQDQTEQYVVNLLTLFPRAEHLYDGVPTGPRRPPLAGMFAPALAGPAPARHAGGMQRLRDRSRFNS